MKDEQREAAIDACLDRLLTNGRGDKAKRLVLTSADGEDLGGWSRPALREKLMALVFDAGYEAVMDRLAEAEYVISGMHHLGTSTAAVNAATSLNQYLEKYGIKKPLPEPYTEGE